MDYLDIRPTLQKNLILGFDTSTEDSDQARASDGMLNVLYSEEYRLTTSRSVEDARRRVRCKVASKDIQRFTLKHIRRPESAISEASS